MLNTAQVPRFQGYRIYPRGFLGADLGMTPKDVLRPYEHRLGHHQYHPDMFRAPKASVEINKNVETAWVHMLRHGAATGDFDFRQNVLTIAMGAFGTNDFLEWTNMQISGPSTGHLHVEFIEDTLRFITTGKRHMTVTNWLGILGISDLGSNVTTKSEDIAAFFIHPLNNTVTNTKLVEVIQRWCSHEGGIEDLVQTLHVLFGDIVS